MDLSTLSSVVTKVAPLLGQAVGGPIGSVVVSLIATLFGVKVTDLDDLVNRITNDPDAAVKLKQLEMAHQDLVSTLKSQDYAKKLDDAEDERKSELEYIKLTGHPNKLITVLAMLAVIGFFAYPLLPIFVTMPPEFLQHGAPVFGTLSAIVVMIYRKYFPN